MHSTPDEHRPLGRDQVWRVLRQVYPADRLAEIVRSEDRAEIRTAAELGVAALDEVWRRRLGVPTGGLAAPPEVRRLADAVLTRAPELRFDNLPDHTCWFVHQLSLTGAAPDFLRDWAADGVPRLLLNVRDPRDALLSMVTFLSGDRGIGAFGDHHVHAGVLRSAGTLGERLTLALTDPTFPGIRTLDETVWMLRHPQVCVVRFEDLVGPGGGGSRHRQLTAVRRVAEFLDARTDVEALAESVFRRDAFTFRVGRGGRWREHFDADHIALFENRYGHLLDLYGYR